MAAHRVMPHAESPERLRAELPAGVAILGPLEPAWAHILTSEAMAFVAGLARAVEPRRRELLARRAARREEIAAGRMLDFLAETRDVRERDWQVAPIPRALADRRVEITGPTERKMVINALNSGARVFMADFEDSHTPTWRNNLDGQVNLRDAVRRTITYTSPQGKQYALGDRVATLLVRPRGWHLIERHVTVDGEPLAGALFDFGLYIFHNAAALLERGSGPYFYLPKLESHLEARLWNDVFLLAQDALGVPRGSIRATVLIETLPAAFEMDEILWELREHAGGLNCGRWDYIFSFIKTFRERPEFVLPDRARVTMESPFLRAYSELVIRTCHRRGIHAMGGMAAQIPIKHDTEANAAALARVRADKLREVRAGHDGTWVAHPGLVPLALEIFDEHMPGPNQIHVAREDVHVTTRDLLAVPDGPITESGLRTNIDVGVQYLESWLRGTGCVPIHNLMEDAATAEISRTQVWQWIRHGVQLADGSRVTPELVSRLLDEVLVPLRRPGDAYALAARLFTQIATGPDCPDFLTTVAYEHLD